MSKVGIIYWSSTGNTEAMAQAVEEGAKAAGDRKSTRLNSSHRSQARMPSSA